MMLVKAFPVLEIVHSNVTVPCVLHEILSKYNKSLDKIYHYDGKNVDSFLVLFCFEALSPLS